MKIKIKKTHKALKEALYGEVSEDDINRAIVYADKQIEQEMRNWEINQNQQFDSLSPQEKEDILSSVNDKIINNLVKGHPFYKPFNFKDTEDSFIGAIRQFLEDNPLSTVPEAIRAIRDAGEELAPKGGEEEEYYLNLQNPSRQVKEVLDVFKETYKNWFIENYLDKAKLRHEKNKYREVLYPTLEDPFENPPIKNQQFYDEALSFISKSDMDEEEEELLEQYKILEMEVVSELPKIRSIKDKINKLVSDHKKKNVFTRDIFFQSKIDNLQKEYEEAIKPLRETALIIFSYALHTITKQKEEEERKQKEEEAEKKRQVEQKQEILAHKYAMAKVLATFRLKDKDKKVKRGDINSAFYDIDKKNSDFNRDLEQGAEFIPYNRWLRQNNTNEINKIYEEYLQFKKYQDERKRKMELATVAKYHRMSIDDFNKLPSGEQNQLESEFYVQTNGGRFFENKTKNSMKSIMENWRKNL